MGPIDQPVLRDCELLLRGKNYSGVGDWVDESGHGHRAVPGAETSFNRQRQAFAFSASNGEQLTIAHTAAGEGLDITTGRITVMAVVETPDATPAALRGIITKTENFSITAGWGIALEGTTGNVEFGIWDTVDFADDYLAGTRDSTIHVVGGVRINGQSVETFLDGAPSGSPSTDDVNSITTTYDTIIGGLTSGGVFDGYIYSVAVWRLALSDNEVKWATYALHPHNHLLPSSFSRFQTGLEIAGKIATPFGGE